MNHKINKIGIIIYAVFLCISCRKDDENNNIELQCERFSSITYDYASDEGKTYTATYDNGNLIELRSDEDRVIFDYDANGYLTEKEIIDNKTSETLFRQTYVPNASGQIIECETWRLIGGELSQTPKQGFTYDGDKLMSINHFNSDGVSYPHYTFEWTGDNPSEMNRGSYYTVVFTYDLSRENVIASRYRYIEYLHVYADEIAYYRFLGKNMMTSSSWQFPSSNPSVDSYRYTYADNGAVEQFFYSSGPNDHKLLWTYHYPTGDCL